MPRIPKEGEMMSHEYIRQFRDRCKHYIDTCEIALSCDFDSTEANAYIKRVCEEHKFTF